MMITKGQVEEYILLGEMRSHMIECNKTLDCVFAACHTEVVGGVMAIQFRVCSVHCECGMFKS